MTIYFVSSADGNDVNSGATLDLAWATLEKAVETGGLSAGNAVAIRRTHSEIPTSDIAPLYTATAGSPILIFGCPRSAHAISSSDWTNGSTAVVVDDADMSREKHQARFIDAPDGNRYTITRVIGASSIVIDREYAGGTVSNDATASIQADTTQSDWDGYDDSLDTIKKSAWEADADDLPLIDFNDGGFQLNLTNDRYFRFFCIDFKDSSDSNGIISAATTVGIYFEGCLIKQTAQNQRIVTVTSAGAEFNRCTIEGSGAGSNQKGLSERFGGSGEVTFRNGAIYNCGDNGVDMWPGNLCLENVNIGVEIANGDEDINFDKPGIVEAIDLKLGGTNGLVLFTTAPTGLKAGLSVENYQKVLGDHRTFYAGGYYERAAVSGETPNKKVSDYVLKIIPNVNTVPNDPFAFKMLQHDVDEVTTGAKTFKYWIYNDTGATLNDTTALDNIWLKAEYVDSFDDTTEYTQIETFSTDIDILDAADADDWDSLSVTLNPATTSKVRLTIFISYYNAATNLFIDPAVVIT